MCIRMCICMCTRIGVCVLGCVGVVVDYLFCVSSQGTLVLTPVQLVTPTRLYL